MKDKRTLYLGWLVIVIFIVVFVVLRQIRSTPSFELLFIPIIIGAIIALGLIRFAVRSRVDDGLPESVFDEPLRKNPPMAQRLLLIFFGFGLLSAVAFGVFVGLVPLESLPPQMKILWPIGLFIIIGGFGSLTILLMSQQVKNTPSQDELPSDYTDDDAL